MSQASFRCDIVSAEEEIFSGEASFLAATGELGELGITPGHAPLLSALRPGPVELRPVDGEPRFYYVSGGFLEVQPWQVTILADVAQRADDIDIAAADEVRQAAERDMAEHKSETDYQQAAVRLAVARAQLRTRHQQRPKG